MNNLPLDVTIRTRAHVFAISLRRENWWGEAYLRFIEKCTAHLDWLQKDLENGFEHVEALVKTEIAMQSARTHEREIARRNYRTATQKKEESRIAREKRTQWELDLKEMRLRDLELSLTDFAERYPSSAKRIARWVKGFQETQLERTLRQRAIRRFRSFCLNTKD